MQVEKKKRKERNNEDSLREIIYPPPHEVHRIRDSVVNRPSWASFFGTSTQGVFSYPIERCQEKIVNALYSGMGSVNDYLEALTNIDESSPVPRTTWLLNRAVRWRLDIPISFFETIHNHQGSPQVRFAHLRLPNVQSFEGRDILALRFPT
jgi:hypothetical protein